MLDGRLRGKWPRLWRWVWVGERSGLRARGRCARLIRGAGKIDPGLGRWRRFTSGTCGVSAGFGLYSEPPFQFVDTFEQLGQVVQGDDLTLGLAIRLSGIAEPFLAIRNVMHNAGLRSNRNAIANPQMSCEADLPCQDHVIAKFGAT